MRKKRDKSGSVSEPKKFNSNNIDNISKNKLDSTNTDDDEIIISLHNKIKNPKNDKMGVDIEKKREKEEANEDEKEKKTFINKTLTLFNFLKKQKKTGKKILRWGRLNFLSIFKIIKFKNSSVNLQFGLDDPAETGKIYGYITTINSVACVNQKNNFRFSVVPIFENRFVFEYSGNINFRTTIFSFIFFILKLIFTFPYIRGLLSYRDYKKTYSNK